jgi:hypothetical protein
MKSPGSTIEPGLLLSPQRQYTISKTSRNERTD